MRMTNVNVGCHIRGGHQESAGRIVICVVKREITIIDFTQESLGINAIILGICGYNHAPISKAAAATLAPYP